MINCIIIYSTSISLAEERKIILKDGGVIFNMKEFLVQFSKNTKNAYKLFEAYEVQNVKKLDLIKVNNHYSFYMGSDKYKDKNITTNLTHYSKLTVMYEKTSKTEKVDLNKKYNPDLLGEKKDNYFTLPYEIEKATNTVESCKITNKIIANNYAISAYNYLLESRNEPLLYLSQDIFRKNNNNPSLHEYATDYKLSISVKIGLINEFEKENEEYLNTPKGKEEYEIFKKIMDPLLKFKKIIIS